MAPWSAAERALCVRRGRMHAASFECSRLLCRPRHFSHDGSSVPRLGITTASIVLDIHLFSL
jgi:hypothetical protein